MKGWKDDKRWSDRFIPEIKRTLGEHLIGEPPVEEDQERNTDLMVLKMDAVRVACRVRKFQYIRGYGHQFTIRAGRPSGNKTELTKIIEGWGDYFFYAFSDPQEKEICQWVLGDLKAFRLFLNRSLAAGKQPWEGKTNTDGSSSFLAFNTADIPNFIVAYSGYAKAA